MKTRTYKTIVSSAVILVIAITAVNAQTVKCDETTAVEKATAELNVITEKDYPNLKNMEGLQHYSNIQYEGQLNKSNEYTLEGRGKNSSLYAVYDKNGNLVKADYIMKNSPLPSFIYRQLSSANLDGWTMTDNKKIVRNFDESTTEYEVKLKKDKMKQTLYFDHAGNRIIRLSKSS